MCKDIPHLGINIRDPRFGAKGAEILKFNFKRRKINVMLSEKYYIFLKLRGMLSIIIKEQFILVINSEVAEGLVYNLMMGCLDNNIVTCVQYFKMYLCKTYDWNVNRHANVGAITDGYE